MSMAKGNLFDTIKENRSLLAQQQPEAEDQTLKVQKLLRAKTGREVGPAETATSNIAEQVARGTTASQIQGLGAQMQVQQAGEDVEQARLAQQERLQRQETDQARKFQTIQTQMETNKILNELGRERGTLSLDKDRSRLEQVTFLMAMRDKKYTDALQDIGKRNRLDDDIAFKEEMQRQEFGLQLNLLQDKLGKQDILAASERDFQKMLSDMSIQDAMNVAEIEMDYSRRVTAIEAELIRQGVSAEAALAIAQTQAAGSESILKGTIGALGSSGKGKFDKNSGEDTDTDLDTDTEELE